MVGKIHPFSVTSRDLPHFPHTELVWVAWDHYRGTRKHDCVFCRNVGEWCLDLIWSKWKHNRFIVYNEFIHLLIYTDTYDKFMNSVASCNMSQVELFFYGFLPFDYFFFEYIIVSLVLFLKYSNMARHIDFFRLTF